MKRNDFLSPGQLSERWSKPRQTLANHRSLGIGVPFYRIGASVRYALRDVEEYERKHRVATEPEDDHVEDDKGRLADVEQNRQKYRAHAKPETGHA